jgi:beta-glucosidase
MAVMKSLNERIESIIASMTLEQKAGLCSGRDEWTTKPLPELGIPAVWVSDGPHGLRRSPLSSTGGYGDQLPATCFPTASALAATWDTGLVAEVGAVIAKECLSQEVNVILGPGANIKRSPLGGRNFEYFSEDPVLAGEIAAAYINGVQAQGVGTSLKHYACNSQETKRMVTDSRLDERTLRELYLRNFEIAIKKGNPWTVMAAYNPVNGEDATANRHLLTDILRDEWGWDGVVVSDWMAVFDRVAGVEAGMDLEMPGNGGFNDAKIVAAVRSGRLSEAAVDTVVRRILRFVLAASESVKGVAEAPGDAHHGFARRVAAEAAVLLKNQGDLLPLKKGLSSVALIGAFAQNIRFQGNGSSEVKPTQIDCQKDELALALDPKCRLTWVPGYRLDNDKADEALIAEAVAAARQAEVAVIHIGLPAHFESEGVDRVHMDLPESMNRLVAAVAAVQPRVAVVLTNGTCVAMPWVDQVPAVLEAWLGGQAAAGGICDVLTGAVNPSGRLAETFPRRLEDTPSFLDLPSGNLGLRFGEGIHAGYRWYDARRIEPLFPFGHGLSYSRFEYSSLELSTAALRGDGQLAVSCVVTNTSRVAGQEVVQLYVGDPVSDEPRPLRELKAFQKIRLGPGESLRVSFRIDRDALSYYHPRFACWVAESGRYDLSIGASSRDIRLQGGFLYQSDTLLEHRFTERTVMRDWIKYPELKALAVNLVKPYFDNVPSLYRGAYADFDVTNPFFIDMPVIKYSRFDPVNMSEAKIREMVAKAASIKVRI